MKSSVEYICDIEAMREIPADFGTQIGGNTLFCIDEQLNNFSAALSPNSEFNDERSFRLHDRTSELFNICHC